MSLRSFKSVCERAQAVLLTCVSLTVLFSITASNAQAVSITSSLTPRAGFTLGNVDTRSYDGVGFDAFLPFSGLVDPQIYSVPSFTGGPDGSKLDFFLLSKVAGYDGTKPGLGDSFGVFDSVGNFIPTIDSSVGVGGVGSYTQAPDEALTVGIKSPEGLFNSDDSKNPDGATHILAMQVIKDGVVNIDHANLAGAMLTFNLLAGDIIIFAEDLLLHGNASPDHLPSDFDYNDMVLVIRASAVPEPATLLLMGSGLVAFAGRRRRSQAA